MTHRYINQNHRSRLPQVSNYRDIHTLLVLVRNKDLFGDTLHRTSHSCTTIYDTTTGWEDKLTDNSTD